MLTTSPQERRSGGQLSSALPLKIVGVTVLLCLTVALVLYAVPLQLPHRYHDLSAWLNADSDRSYAASTPLQSSYTQCTEVGGTTPINAVAPLAAGCSPYDTLVSARCWGQEHVAPINVTVLADGNYVQADNAAHVLDGDLSTTYQSIDTQKNPVIKLDLRLLRVNNQLAEHGFTITGLKLHVPLASSVHMEGFDVRVGSRPDLQYYANAVCYHGAAGVSLATSDTYLCTSPISNAFFVYIHLPTSGRTLAVSELEVLGFPTPYAERLAITGVNEYETDAEPSCSVQQLRDTFVEADDKQVQAAIEQQVAKRLKPWLFLASMDKHEVMQAQQLAKSNKPNQRPDAASWDADSVQLYEEWPLISTVDIDTLTQYYDQNLLLRVQWNMYVQDNVTGEWSLRDRPLQWSDVTIIRPPCYNDFNWFGKMMIDESGNVLGAINILKHVIEHSPPEDIPPYMDLLFNIADQPRMAERKAMPSWMYNTSFIDSQRSKGGADHTCPSATRRFAKACTTATQPTVNITNEPQTPAVRSYYSQWLSVDGYTVNASRMSLNGSLAPSAIPPPHLSFSYTESDLDVWFPYSIWLSYWQPSVDQLLNETFQRMIDVSGKGSCSTVLQSQQQWLTRRNHVQWRGAPNHPRWKTQDNWMHVTRARLVALSQKFPHVLDARMIDQCMRCSDGVAEAIARTFQPHHAQQGYQDMFEHIEYRYLLDADGNGWSARFGKLLATGGVVMKERSIYEEWWYDLLQPDHHYKPFHTNLSDVLPMIDELRQDQAASHQIGLNGLRFANTYLSDKTSLQYSTAFLRAYSALLIKPWTVLGQEIADARNTSHVFDQCPPGIDSGSRHFLAD